MNLDKNIKSEIKEALLDPWVDEEEFDKEWERIEDEYYSYCEKYDFETYMDE